MTVTVAWPVGKQRGDNLEPRFRPTGSNRLEGKETTIARLVYEAYTLMDPAWNASLALGRISEGTYQKRIDTALESLSAALQRILYEAHAAEMDEMAGRIRESINRDLRRLGSPVRLVATGEARKAANVYVEWAGKAVTTFDAALPGSTSLVYAQFRTGQIVTYMGTEQVGMIRDQIAQAFTQVQQWGGGRITTGLTPQQVSSNLFSLLAQTTPAQMELTAAQVAAYRSGYTNGLFPSWAKAVNNYGDRTATLLDKQGITGDRARTLLDKRTKRYGDKLRRARSRMIARTEIAKVQNAAMQATIDSAYSDGLVGNRAQKVWVTGPFDVCDICQPLSGRRVPYNGYFQWRNGSGPHGPAHPNCRCIIRMVPNTSRAPKHMGAGTPADPFRYQFADGWTAPVTPVRGVPRLPGVRAPKVPKVPKLPPLPTPSPTPLLPPAEPPVPAATVRPTPTGPTMADSVRYARTAKTAKVVDPVVAKIDEVLAAPQPYSSGPTSITLRTKGTMPGEGGFFSPKKQIPRPSEPRRPYVRSHYATDAEYDEAIAKYEAAFARYRERIAEGRAANWKRSQIEAFGKGTADDIGDMQNALGHEWWHRLDYVEDVIPASGPRGFARTVERSRMKEAFAEVPQGGFAPRFGVSGEFTEEVAFLKAAAESDAIATLARLGGQIDPKWVEYATSPQELWARAGAQWLATTNGTPQMAAAMAESIGLPAAATVADVAAGGRWYGFQWRADEFAEKIAPLVEQVLRKWGLLA